MEESEEIPEKQKRVSGTDADPVIEGEGLDIVEPTKHEIEESFKPENVINVETVRDKKRGVHKKILEKNKETSDVREVDSVKMYLIKWRDDRDAWKFEKKKQIYIQNHCFDPSKIQADEWGACLEYLEGSKGKSREALVTSAEKMITELDSKDQKDEVVSIKYTRARDLLQMLN